MSYNPTLAARVRAALKALTPYEEKKMFGGLAFMVDGQMCCGVVNDVLVARVDRDDYERMLGEPGARPMDFTGRPMRGFLFVSQAGVATPRALETWMLRGLAVVRAKRAAALKPSGRRGATPSPPKRPRSPRRA